MQIGSKEWLDPGGRPLNSVQQVGMRILGGNPEVVAIAPLDPLGGQPPELPAQGADVPVLHRLGQTQPLKGPGNPVPC